MNDSEEDTLPRGGSWWVGSLGSKSSKKRARQHEEREDQGQGRWGQRLQRICEDKHNSDKNTAPWAEPTGTGVCLVCPGANGVVAPGLSLSLPGGTEHEAVWRRRGVQGRKAVAETHHKVRILQSGQVFPFPSSEFAQFPLSWHRGVIIFGLPFAPGLGS